MSKVPKCPPKQSKHMWRVQINYTGSGSVYGLVTGNDVAGSTLFKRMLGSTLETLDTNACSAANTSPGERGSSVMRYSTQELNRIHADVEALLLAKTHSKDIIAPVVM